ncbi:mannose-6-phosphate isomerase [Saitoella complicata NRRL Y-17804]|uniref:mannose-6-phosphate isomerase n=1 Tax=Saitoella complicata (strain BCRC 22490 / CBS 7301 / JCM 7358 / NBRC 10748 / NRRL Y-17804) TaxID=698492 RepID=UPI000866ACC0|nr:mannose-6-phosphate isomerase [Saitoella complicata NRRL Y-17804]ODQ52688.1 mannose-6-phosphate isomerase [Saitoella complicata NRRL Y-17804]
MVLPVPLFQIAPVVQNYDWGVNGKDALVAQFAASTPNSNTEISKDKPYAELWMGTLHHPATEISSGRPLKELLDDNEALLSKTVNDKYGDLPFLLKILSVGKALSIQAHPDKTLAKKLHADDPKNYKDDNHKPEMAIALTDFEGFCGFRPVNEIASFLSAVPALRSIIGEEIAVKFQKTVKGKEDSKDEEVVKANKAALRSVFESLMTKSEDEIANLLIRLNEQFPKDVGLFCTFLLNYCKLKPGEAMFLRALDIHAYLSGDIVECMAASDNVVRAGFTPKFKDVKNLVSMLTYNYAGPTEQKMKPENFERASGKTTLYDPPIEEFSVLRTVLGQGEKETTKGLQGPSIVIATKGSGSIKVGNEKKEVKGGYVFFVGADAEVELESSSEEFVLHRAFAEV